MFLAPDSKFDKLVRLIDEEIEWIEKHKRALTDTQKRLKQITGFLVED